MRFTVALLLLLASAAGAQTVEPDELTYGPFKPGPRDPSFAIAVAPHGMLLAWSEVDPETQLSLIRTGLLDFNAQLIGEIHTIPTAGSNVHATSPAVATDGSTFFVAWVERNRYTLVERSIGGVQTDANGKPVGVSRRQGAAIDSTPALVWDGVAYRVHEAARRIPFATPWANGWVDWINAREPARCWFGCWTRPPTGPGKYLLDWAIITPQRIRTGLYGDRDLGGPPAVVATEDDLLIVWSTEEEVRALRVIDGVAADVFVLPARLRRGTAVHAAESLVVFDDNGDIFGSVIDGDRFGEPFPISTSAGIDSLPRVYLTGPNRYLVTWYRENGFLAGRFVTIDPV